MYRQRIRLTMSGQHATEMPVNLHDQELMYPEHRFWEHVKVLCSFCFSDTLYVLKAITGLDRESAHPLQLHAAKQSCCTTAKLGATDQLPTQGDN